MKALLIIPAIAVSLCGVVALAGDELVGSARALTGDTLDIGGAQVRLYGIQAPHLGQTCLTRKGKSQQCGRMATMALAEMVRGQKVRCETKGPVVDQGVQGRLQALCFVGWMNVSEEMVASGFAMADPATGADFVRAETFAKVRREGLWQGEFTPPWAWQGE